MPEKEQPEAQATDPVAKLLKEEGLYDERFAYDAASAVRELGSSKKKITNLQADMRKNSDRLRRLEEAVADKREVQRIDETFEDPHQRSLAQENLSTKKDVRDLRKEIWELGHSDWKDYESQMAEVLDENPSLAQITDPGVRLNTVYELARAKTVESGVPKREEEAEARGAIRAVEERGAYREAGGTTGSDPVAVRTSLLDELTAMKEKMAEELDGAEDGSQRNVIANKYNRIEKTIMAKYK